MKKLLLASVLAIGAMIGSPFAAGAAGITDKEILIGTYTDLSGVTVSWGVNNSNAIRMAFDEVNAKGGINGRMIRYIVEDNQYQVPRSIQAANKLMNSDRVFLMIANGGTPMNNAVMPEQLEKGVPNMFPLTSARSMYEPFHRLKFGLAASYYDQTRAGVKFFVDKRGKKAICQMTQDTDFGRDVSDGLKDQLKAMNLTMVGETLHKPTDTDFSAAVARMKAAKCDLVVIGGITRDTIQVISAIRKSGWDVETLGNIATYDASVAEVPGGVTEGFYTMTSVLLLDPADPKPDVQIFVKNYKAKFNREPNFAAQIGYSAAYLLAEGLKNAGKNLDLDSFIGGMEAIKDYQDIFGSPKFNYGPKLRQGSNASYLVQVKSGKWVVADKSPMGY